MSYNFFITDVTEKDQKYNITLFIKDDPRYLGWIFNFNNIELSIDRTGVGVNYDLSISIPNNQILSEKNMNEAKEIGHLILEKIMVDMTNAINNGLDQSQENSN